MRRPTRRARGSRRARFAVALQAGFQPHRQVMTAPGRPGIIASRLVGEGGAVDGRDLTQDDIETLRGMACADVHWVKLALLAAELGIATPPSAAARRAARLMGFAKPDDIGLVDINHILTFLRAPNHRREVRAQTTAKKIGREVIEDLDKQITAEVCALALAVGTSLGVKFTGVIVDVDRVFDQAVWLIFLPAHNGQPCPNPLAAHSNPIPKRRLRKGEWPTKAVLEQAES